ncbi:MAG: hypothetical protein BGO69_15030 [Bacteroidetes bacterium 46-16]|nr:MAG: hypothetical protein BGO69_15030 [Bacteroidetes bacterium 46-16]
MKIIRHIAFLLSLMVMMGHDIVPHIHMDDDHTPAQSASLPSPPNTALANIENAFSYFQHSSAERNLVYLGASEKKAGFELKVLNDFTAFLSTVDYPLIWYANYKKQRFWDNANIPPSYKPSSSFLRGPPSC